MTFKYQAEYTRSINLTIALKPISCTKCVPCAHAHHSHSLSSLFIINRAMKNQSKEGSTKRKINPNQSLT